MNITPIPPAPERATMRVEAGTLLVLQFSEVQYRPIGTVDNPDIARRIAACWNKFIPLPTSLIEEMPGTVAEMALALSGGQDPIEAAGAAIRAGVPR